jgi:hypothetical protein
MQQSPWSRDLFQVDTVYTFDFYYSVVPRFDTFQYEPVTFIFNLYALI